MPTSFWDIAIVLTIASITALAILYFWALPTAVQIALSLSVASAMVAIALI